METTLAQKAISLALSGEWNKAIEVNLQILQETDDDIDALNRLARAYAETGNIAKAKEAAKKVVKIDSLNTIALKCLEKWKSIKKIEANRTPTTPIDSFLEESGKTKIVSLLNTGDIKAFLNLGPGEEVKLASFSHKVSVITQDDKYIGRLPDDIAARLKNLIKNRNEYRVFIKSIEPKEITVFIRGNIQSFPKERNLENS